MKLDQLYPSNYLKSSDIKGSTPIVVISNVTIEKLGEDQRPVVYFQGKQKGMVLNKTNAFNIGTFYGDDTDLWIGKPIQLRVEAVQGPNGIVDGLRVGLPQPASQSMPQPAPQPASDAFDDDIPF